MCSTAQHWAYPQQRAAGVDVAGTALAPKPEHTHSWDPVICSTGQPVGVGGSGKGDQEKAQLQKLCWRGDGELSDAP